MINILHMGHLQNVKLSYACTQEIFDCLQRIFRELLLAIRTYFPYNIPTIAIYYILVQFIYLLTYSNKLTISEFRRVICKAKYFVHIMSSYVTVNMKA